MLRAVWHGAARFGRRRARRHGHNVRMTTTRPVEPTESAESQALLLQLLDSANRADPYPIYARFRDRGPLQLPEAHLAVFSAYRYCDEVLRHPSSSSDRMKSAIAQQQISAGLAPRPQFPPGFCSSTRPITPGCANWSARRSPRKW